MSRAAEIQMLFFSALSCPPTQRHEFLEVACADNLSLARDVETLLFEEKDAVTALDRCFWQEEDSTTRALEGLLDRRGRVGPYRILRQIKASFEGGLYEAVPYEDTEAGVCLLRTADTKHNSPAALDRLRRERDTLVRLVHPALPALTASGTTPDGIFYVATEFPQGESLIQFAERLGLPLARRVELLRTITAALVSAHQERVYEWVLGEATLRVTPDGRPWLIGLNIAGNLRGAALQPGAGESPVSAAVAPPPELEPLLSEPAAGGARNLTDLGVVAYELLCGARPTGHARDAAPETAGAKLLRPSEMNPRLRGELRGELDRICLRLLAANGQKPYASMRAVLTDMDTYLRRHVEDSDAEPGESGLTRMLSRHRAAFLSTALGGLLVGLPLLQQNQRLRRAEERASRARGLTIEMFRQLRETARATRIDNLTRPEDFARRALDYVEAMTLKTGNDAELRQELAEALLAMQTLLPAPGQTGKPAAPSAASLRLKPASAGDRSAGPKVVTARKGSRKTGGASKSRRFVDSSGVVFDLEERDWSSALNR